MKVLTLLSWWSVLHVLLVRALAHVPREARVLDLRHVPVVVVDFAKLPLVGSCEAFFVPCEAFFGSLLGFFLLIIWYSCRL